MKSMEQYRREAAEQEEQVAKARRQREREERRERDKNSAVELLRAEMHVALADLRDKYEIQGEAVGQAMGEMIDQTLERVEQLIKKTQSEMFVLIEQRFGHLLGRIDAIAGGEPRARSQPFKFANEPRDDIVDLPNPLRKMN
jgi:hypothetical protein